MVKIELKSTKELVDFLHKRITKDLKKKFKDLKMKQPLFFNKGLFLSTFKKEYQSFSDFVRAKNTNVDNCSKTLNAIIKNALIDKSVKSSLKASIAIFKELGQKYNKPNKKLKEVIYLYSVDNKEYLFKLRIYSFSLVEILSNGSSNEYSYHTTKKILTFNKVPIDPTKIGKFQRLMNGIMDNLKKKKLRVFLNFKSG
ncbi:hypothetical protein DID75_04375 [Candidatus Marinamargulisbacteria bacterium SCGC AG-410-N11]|nr:hypothetical protein DID75_04375 [Candidatus Marinamargulisbacteria bacterium SCGC AG-410-N11]